MPRVKYIKMYKNGESPAMIEEGRVERFLEQGWLTVEPSIDKEGSQKSKSSKNKITAVAQVTSKTSDEEEVSAEPSKDELESIPCVSCGSEEHAYKDCGEDNWTFSEDDLKTANKED